MANVRKDQAKLSPNEWDILIQAINSMHGVAAASPAYRDFVSVHVRAMSGLGMQWRVHSMPGMVGLNFLAWHRQFLIQFEKRLRKFNPNITLPYWDWLKDRTLPPALNKASLLSAWGVTREWTPALLPIEHDSASLNARTSFPSFQGFLEHLHNEVHRAVGGPDGFGTMMNPNSPGDPIFFLHHANVDRLWAAWQAKHRRALPPNVADVLQPRPLFGVRVRDVTSISKLGYRYG